ncbi:MAG: OmpA family protein, partial [Leptolyngbya sp. SIO1D8]|nr:OmpA family protein [Leptolyngbya sp. SIO1D8]
SFAILGTGLGLLGGEAIAQQPTGFEMTVNSAQDGTPTPDEGLTLREAIAIANGTLPIEALSPAEQAQVTPGADSSRIAFNLPPEDTTIYLTDVLPPLTAEGLVMDGTTQPGYGDTEPQLPEIPIPMVSLTPAPGLEVFRGLTVQGNNITIRGLNLYGFWSAARSTLTTPSADIFVTSAPPPADAGLDSPHVSTFELADTAVATQQTVIEQNWLGFLPDGSIPERRSAFGVYVFNGVDVQVTNNWIQHHEGSGVITGFRATGLQLVGNAIIANGIAGMPDGIRLEGKLEGAEIRNNLVCANDGSGIFLFKPEGTTLIQDNDIRFNGRRFQRAAVYVMGRGHQLLDNEIGFQPGPGVAVAAFPLSDRNLIRGNRFTHLDGLSIDLVTHHNVTVQDFQQADGPNPPRNSHHRRTDTANGAINAPEFAQYAFGQDENTVRLIGKADPGSEVDLYQVNQKVGVYSPLNEPVMTTVADDNGDFEFIWDTGEAAWVSAIASDPLYGTSEPSPVISVAGMESSEQPAVPYDVTCFPPEPVAQTPPLEPPPAPLRLRVPRRIHFALDRSNISPESANLLDQIAAAMLAYPSLVVELHGHTDPRASNAYNQALSERRSLAARNYLLRQGIAAERMRIVPFGETQRFTQGSTRLDYARDRRVEFVFEDTQGLEIIFEDVETDLQVE